MSLTPRINKLEQNLIINGNFDFWQRGVSFTAASEYSADRWKKTFTGTGGQSTDVPNNKSKYSFSMSITSGDSPRIDERLEQIDASQLADTNITISYWIKQTSGTLSSNAHVYIQTPTALDNWATATDEFSTDEVAIVSLNTWQYVTHPVSISSILPVNGLGLSFRPHKVNPGGGVTTYLYSQIMVNIGDQAGSFSRAGRNIGEELAMCQRYYHASVGRTVMKSVYATIGATYYMLILHPVTMRSNALYTYSNFSASNFSASAPSLGIQSPEHARVAKNAIATGNAFFECEYQADAEL